MVVSAQSPPLVPLVPRFPERHIELKWNHIVACPAIQLFLLSTTSGRWSVLSCWHHSLLCPKGSRGYRREWGIKQTGGWGRPLLILMGLLSLPFRHLPTTPLPWPEPRYTHYCSSPLGSSLLPAFPAAHGLWSFPKNMWLYYSGIPQSSVAPNCCVHGSTPGTLS